MPVFQLTDELVFPPVDLSEPEGILAVGGDLSAERLLLAYRSGIFPWYSDGDPILWWSPDPRFVLVPEELRIPKSMKRVLNSGKFEVTYDREFRKVMEECSGPRKRERGTWITPDMLEAYVRLHEMGYAHSVEVRENGKLCGGLYGVSLGRVFFGESMFSRTDNASKTALITLVTKLGGLGFRLIDSQVHTPHVEMMGAREIGRDEYLKRLEDALQYETLKGDWGKIL